MTNYSRLALFIVFYLFRSVTVHAEVDKTSITYDRESGVLVIDGINVYQRPIYSQDALSQFINDQLRSGEHLYFFSYDLVDRNLETDNVQRATVLGRNEQLLEHAILLRQIDHERYFLENYNKPGSTWDLFGKQDHKSFDRGAGLFNRLGDADIQSRSPNVVDKEDQLATLCLVGECLFGEEDEYSERYNYSDSKVDQLASIQEFLIDDLCNYLGCTKEGTNCIYCCNRKMGCCDDNCPVLR